jgi:hypothetical protein
MDEQNGDAQDVYAAGWPGFGAQAPLADGGVTVLLERCPGALARAFALLCTLDLVPAVSSGTCSGEDAIRLDLHFDSIPGNRLDLLLRKFGQLTECLEVIPISHRRQAVGG